MSSCMARMLAPVTIGNLIASRTTQHRHRQTAAALFLQSPLHTPGADTRMHAHAGLCCVQSPYHCNLLIAGFDEGAGASLYWVDYLATLHKVNTGGTGYGELSEIGRLSVLLCGRGVRCGRWQPHACTCIGGVVLCGLMWCGVGLV
jgi:hypothetical protein